MLCITSLDVFGLERAANVLDYLTVTKMKQAQPTGSEALNIANNRMSYFPSFPYVICLSGEEEAQG